MPEILTPDLCVIGAGSGGLSLAAAAAAFGVSVVLVERGRMGGDCLNDGCVPSKALIAAAAHAAAIRKAPRFGIDAGEPEIDFGRVMAHVRGVIAEIAPFDSVERFTGLGVRVLKAEARFLDPRTIAAGAFHIRARRFVVATGSAPRVPALPGLSAVPFLTNETLFARTERPEHLLILGGGPIGMEMAQAHRRLGSRVTLVDSGRVLARDDPDLAAIVLSRLRAEGVDIREQSRAISVAPMAAGLSLSVETSGGLQTIVASHLLLAVGRTANTAGLGLDLANIETTARGIAVGRGLRTTNSRVYAIGDVAGAGQFTHLAGQHAGLVARAILFRLPIRQTPDLVPHVTFTDPELGQVGPTEAEARRRGLSVDILTFPYAEIDRARTDRETEGLMKLVAGKGGRLLGAGVAGAKAGELTNLLSLAVSKGMRVRDLTAFVSPCPTYAEIGKRAATAYYAPYAKRGVVRGLVRLLARFG